MLFGILILSGQQDRIKRFYNTGFTDHMLPITLDNTLTVGSLTEKHSHVVEETFNPHQWGNGSWEAAFKAFYDQQWLFLAPTFQTRRDELVQQSFGPKTRMPFWSNGKILGDTNFSVVKEVSLHRNHLDTNMVCSERILCPASLFTPRMLQQRR